jgi:apolipoprotein N-acyltransferase
MFAVLIGRIAKTPAMLVWQVPVFWVAMEFLRANLFTGLPWELLGYSQHGYLHMIQIADIFGIYGVSGILALGNAVAFIGYLFIRNRDWGGIHVTKRCAAVSFACFISLLLAVLVYGNRRIQTIDETITRSTHLEIAVIQGNIDQAIKWDREFQEKTIDDYLQLSESIVSDDLDLIVWPETATPFYLLSDAKPTERVFEGLKRIDRDFLIGSPSYKKQTDRIVYFNSAYLIEAEGGFAGKYDKVHLVPFGEYVPFKKWLPFIGKLVEQVGDFIPGKKGRTMPWKDNRIGMQICYEIIFPGLSRTMVQNEADLLVNITNDAWFGRTGAPYQHFSMAVIRAVENRRSLVRAANTGISGFVDPVGRVLAATPLFKGVALKKKVPVLKTKSFYTRHGDVFAIICILAALVGVMNRYRSKLRFRQ